MVAATVINLHQEISYDSEVCCQCGIVWWMPAAFQRKKRSDQSMFYCPNGHGQYYMGESDKDKIERLEREKAAANSNAKAAQARAEDLWQQQQKLATANRKLRKRAKNGVCPCCKRTFKELAAHMQSKHPEFKA